MGLKERDRLGALSRVEEDGITRKEAARRLQGSYRRAKRLWDRDREVGDAGRVHRLRGRSSNNRPAADAGESERSSCPGSSTGGSARHWRRSCWWRVTGLGWTTRRCRAEGLWAPGGGKRRVHRRRERRSCFGERVQLRTLEGITTIEAANAYLEREFLPDHNARFVGGPNGGLRRPRAGAGGGGPGGGPPVAAIVRWARLRSGSLTLASAPPGPATAGEGTFLLRFRHTARPSGSAVQRLTHCRYKISVYAVPVRFLRV